MSWDTLHHEIRWNVEHCARLAHTSVQIRPRPMQEIMNQQSLCDEVWGQLVLSTHTAPTIVS